MSIKTLSPFYVYVSWLVPETGLACESYTLKLYVWDGSKFAPPAIPEYLITKLNAAASGGIDKVNVSRILNDFIEFNISPQIATGLVDGNNQVWLKWEVYYDDITAPSAQAIELAVKGYGYFLQGENPQLPADKILLDGDEFKVSRDGIFVLPFLAAEPDVLPASIVLDAIESLNANEVQYTFHFLNFNPETVYLQRASSIDGPWIGDQFPGDSPSGPVYVAGNPTAGLFYRVYHLPMDLASNILQLPAVSLAVVNVSSSNPGFNPAAGNEYKITWAISGFTIAPGTHIDYQVSTDGVTWVYPIYLPTNDNPGLIHTLSSSSEFKYFRAIYTPLSLVSQAYEFQF